MVVLIYIYIYVCVCVSVFEINIRLDSRVLILLPNSASHYLLQFKAPLLRTVLHKLLVAMSAYGDGFQADAYHETRKVLIPK